VLYLETAVGNSRGQWLFGSVSLSQTHQSYDYYIAYPCFVS